METIKAATPLPEGSVAGLCQAERRSPIKMKLCFSTLGCPDWTISQVAEKGAAYGFDGVELKIMGDKHIDPALSKAERKQIKEMFASVGLAIPTISGYTIFNGNDDNHLTANYEAALRNGELAADLGAPYLRIFPGGPITAKGVETLRRACDAIHNMGVTAIMEIHTVPYRTGKDMAQLLSAVNSPGLKVLWDVGHSLAENETLEDSWKYVGADVRHVHIKDHDANDNQCLQGEGTFPTAQVVKLLQDKGFDGYYSLEWEKSWKPELQEPEIALPQYVEYMRGIKF